MRFELGLANAADSWRTARRCWAWTPQANRGQTTIPKQGPNRGQTTIPGGESWSVPCFARAY